MVANRESILKVGKTLAELVIEGGGATPTAVRMAEQLYGLCKDGGSYTKRYEDHEERVLMRHLNLYRNKLARAKTDAERSVWRTKFDAQEAKVRAYKSGGEQDLDLDGL
jgi:hypothetical protein